jgi:Kdo2-lipid IVA lauroyltransferase/acyltransferase
MKQSAVPRLKRWRRRMRSAVIRLFAWVLSRLPVRLLSLGGAVIGWLAYHLARTERQRALASLHVAFPQSPDNHQMARASFVHLGRVAGESLGARAIDADIETWVDWPAPSRAAFDAALRRGKGMVFVTGHVGHWELLARRVALAGYDTNVVGKETWDPRLTDSIESHRARAGVNTIWRAAPAAPRQILRALRRNGCLGLLIDQDTDVQSVWVPFFGRPAKTPRGAADLVLRTGAAAIVGFCTRIAPSRYRLEVREVPLPDMQGETAVVELTRRFNEAIEVAIRAAPEQWVWLHQRWKSPPPSH